MKDALNHLSHNLWWPFLAMAIVGAGMAAMDWVIGRRR